MSKEEKELLLRDLCARLPYKIMVKVNDTQGIMDEIDIPNERIFVSSLNPFLYGGAKASWFTVNGDKIYPYLRPMSSMTEEEKKEYKKLCDERVFKYALEWVTKWFDTPNSIDWLNAHHFDYRGLIEKGLAIEAPEGMYNQGIFLGVNQDSIRNSEIEHEWDPGPCWDDGNF